MKGTGHPVHEGTLSQLGGDFLDGNAD